MHSWSWLQDFIAPLLWYSDDKNIVRLADAAQIQSWLYFLAIYGVVSVLMLVLHRARATLTLAPMLSFCGLLTFLVWQLAQIGWWVDWQDFKINASLLSMVPALLMGAVVIYAMDGTRAARAYHAVLLGGAILGMSYALFLDILGRVTPTPAIFIAPLLLQVALATALVLAAVAAVFCVELARRISPYLTMPLGFIGGMMVFLPLWSVLTYGFGNGWLNMVLEWPEYVLTAAPAVPILALYNIWAVRAKELMPERPLWHFVAANDAALREAPSVDDSSVIDARQQLNELRQLNHALQQAETLRHQQMQLSPLAMLELDRQHRLRRFNQAAEDLVAKAGLPPLGLGLPLLDYWPDLLVALSATDWPQQKLCKHLVAVAGGMRIECTVLPMGALAQPVGYSVFAEDVTAREQAAQRRIVSERIRGIHQTGQMIHHDFSNLMLAIQAHVQVLLQKIPLAQQHDSEVQQAQLAIHSAYARAQQMLSQLGGGQVLQKPELKPVSLDALVHEAIRLILPQARRQHITVQQDIAANTWVEADATQMLRVVVNLLSNALRAIGEHGTIAVVTLVDQHGITCRVADTGCGMSPEQLAKAFDPAFSTKGDGQGGLGLAISYLITEAHGGRLTLRSVQNHGTTAELWLPSAVGATQHSDQDTYQPSVLAQENILLLLQQNDLRQKLADHLTASGAEVAELTSAPELAAMLNDTGSNWTLLIRGKDIVLEPELWHQCRFLSDVVIDPLGQTPPRVRLQRQSTLDPTTLLQELHAA